jgi:hypothetical protein
MRFSKNFKHESYFTQKNILSPTLALFFIIEESLLLLLIAIQISNFLGIRLINNSIQFFQNPILIQNYIWFIGSIVFFAIGYLVISLRDRNVWLIHHNFSRLLFGTIKLKITMTNLKVFVFVFTELIFSFLIALSIFIYMDPNIEVTNFDGSPIPTEIKVVIFILLIGISFLLFSHSKEFRTNVYGPTPLQKRLHLGKHEIKRVTHTRSGYLRFKAKKRN